jgi:integrase
MGSGSSPFIRTTKPANNAGFEVNKVESSWRTLAHLVLEDAPGGVNLTAEMKAMNINLHTTGNRWYVSYYITNSTGKKERVREYGFVNKEKDLDKRMQLLIQVQRSIYLKLSHSSPTVNINQSAGVYKASYDAVEQKQHHLKRNAYLAIKKNLKPWFIYLILNKMETMQIHEVKSSDILKYRTWRFAQTVRRKIGDKMESVPISNRTVNNNIDELRTLFNYFMQMPDIVLDKNPCDGLSNVPSRSEVHVAYSDEEAKMISDRLKEKEPFLLFYIKFIAYVFLRCDEARLLQVKHFDIPNRKITLTADNNKTNIRTQKLIPDIFINDIIAYGLDKYPKDYYIFSPNRGPGPNPVHNNYFSKRFRPHKKHFGLTRLHTIYGFRHTFVCQLIKAGLPWHKIMKLTGHKTMSAFEKYARSIMQLPAEDLSGSFAVEL